LYSVVADIDYLHVIRIELVNFSVIGFIQHCIRAMLHTLQVNICQMRRFCFRTFCFRFFSFWIIMRSSTPLNDKKNENRMIWMGISTSPAHLTLSMQAWSPLGRGDSLLQIQSFVMNILQLVVFLGVYAIPHKLVRWLSPARGGNGLRKMS
jgi:hypothetical protein